MKGSALALGAFAAALCGASAARAELETSWRMGAWSGPRLGEAKPGLLAAEVWARGRWLAADGASARLEAWAGADPVGRGETGLDAREAAVAFESGPLRLTAGRQLYAWGRSDRINPTDVVGARDLRRLTEEDGDNRRGIAAVSAELDLAGGVVSLHWLPEFRPTVLPVSPGAPGRRVAPDGTATQVAVRYERFGRAVDWSLSYADLADRTPWFDLGLEAGRPSLALRHPRLRTLGGDLATTLGPYGVRAEAALYDYDRADLTGLSPRRPRFAVVLGADRDLPGQVNLNVQAVVRGADSLPVPAGLQARSAARNASVQYAWRDTVTGGAVRLRKPFAAERGAVEATLAGYGGGGAYAQVRVGYALRDGLRATLLAERFSGGDESLFGRLKDNTLITLGLRAGF